MLISLKTALAVAATVLVAHAAIGNQVASGLQAQADLAMLPIVKADKITVQASRLGKAPARPAS